MPNTNPKKQPIVRKITTQCSGCRLCFRAFVASDWCQRKRARTLLVTQCYPMLPNVTQQAIETDVFIEAE